VKGKTLVLATVRHMNGMSEVEVVESLMTGPLPVQGQTCGPRGFYSVDVLHSPSSNWSWPSPWDVGIHGSTKGSIRSERREEQVSFRLLVP